MAAEYWCLVGVVVLGCWSGGGAVNRVGVRLMVDGFWWGCLGGGLGGVGGPSGGGVVQSEVDEAA